MMKLYKWEEALEVSMQGKKNLTLLYQTIERDFPIILKFKLKPKAENNKYPYVWFFKKYKSLKNTR